MSKKSFDKKEALIVLEANREQWISDQITFEQLQEKYYDPSSIAAFIAYRSTSKDIVKHKVLINIFSWILVVLIILKILLAISLLFISPDMSASLIIIIVSIIFIWIYVYILHNLKKDPFNALITLFSFSILWMQWAAFMDDYWSIGFSIFLLIFSHLTIRKVFPHLTFRNKLKKDDQWNYIFPN